MAFEAKNRNFSLFELIIAIAILAALAAIIGIQVLPPLERAKEARDLELVEYYLSAAEKALSNPEIGLEQSGVTVIDIYTGSYQAAEANLQQEIREITGYHSIDALKNEALSQKGRRITDIRIMIAPGEGSICVQAVNGENLVFDKTFSELAF